MNKHLINNKKNLFRGITGLAVAGLAGGFMSAGSVAATDVCIGQDGNGNPMIIDCPPTFTLTPLPGLGAPEVNLGGDIDYGAIIDYVNNRDNNDTDDTSDGSGFGGVDIPSAEDLVDPDRFAPLEPNLDVFEQDNPFLGTDDDAEPELAQPEAQPEVEVQPEAQPEAQPEVEARPEAQREVDSTDVGVTEVAPEETPDTVTPEAVAPEAATPETVTPEVVAPEMVLPDTDSTDTNTDADADVDREIIEAAPVEVLTTDDTTTGGVNLGLYAGILLILGGGGSLAAIAATRRNRD